MLKIYGMGLLFISPQIFKAARHPESYKKHVRAICDNGAGKVHIP